MVHTLLIICVLRGGSVHCPRSSLTKGLFLATLRLVVSGVVTASAQYLGRLLLVALWSQVQVPDLPRMVLPGGQALIRERILAQEVCP